LTTYFMDTSALAKRYVIEKGAAWIRSEIKAGNQVVISDLTTVEMVSLLARKRREGNISNIQFVRARNSFLKHADTVYLVIGLDKPILALARDLVARQPLRTLDAIQLASALAAVKALGSNPIFVSADKRLLTIAAAEGLPTDNPENHP
jgi:uncharacterized protein